MPQDWASDKVGVVGEIKVLCDPKEKCSALEDVDVGGDLVSNVKRTVQGLRRTILAGDTGLNPKHAVCGVLTGCKREPDTAEDEDQHGSENDPPVPKQHNKYVYECEIVRVRARFGIATLAHSVSVLLASIAARCWMR